MQANRLSNNVLLSIATLSLSLSPLSALGQKTDSGPGLMSGVVIWNETGFTVPIGTPSPYISHLYQCLYDDAGDFDYTNGESLHLGTRLCTCQSDTGREDCPLLSCETHGTFYLGDCQNGPPSSWCEDDALRIKSSAFSGGTATVELEICYKYNDFRGSFSNADMLLNVGQGTTSLYALAWLDVPRNPGGCQTFRSLVPPVILSGLAPGDYEIQLSIYDKNCDGWMNPPSEPWTVYLSGETENQLLHVSDTGVVTLN